MSRARIETSAGNLRYPRGDVNEFPDSEIKKEEAKDAHEHARVRLCYYPQCAISNMT